MVFSSLLFLFRFLPVVLAAYYIMPKKCHNLVLFISSLVFYAWGEPVYVLLVLFSTVTDYLAGMAVSHYKGKGLQKRAFAAVLCSVVTNLSILAFFKYAGFLVGNINKLAGTDIPIVNVALPIGISFYTFQTMSYTVDVYRNDAKVQKILLLLGHMWHCFHSLWQGQSCSIKQ